MAIFDKFQQLAAMRQALAESGIQAINVVMEEVVSATEAVVNGRRVILAGTNNYLGLTFHPDCIEAACQAARAQGTGTTGSRAANGSYSIHVQLERELADFLGRRGVIVFSTGYVANLGMLSTLAGPGDVFVIDGGLHASIYDGCRLSGAEIIRFRHNDAADLDKRLRRLGDRIANTLIVVEGIYSMLGDRAPLAEIAAVKRRYPGAFLVVDEAHSLGVLGEHGRGHGRGGRGRGRRGFRHRHIQQEPRRDRGVLRQRPPRARPHPLRQSTLHLHRLSRPPRSSPPPGPPSALLRSQPGAEGPLVGERPDLVRPAAAT